MATLRDLRNSIKGVQNTKKITNAMKMVASAKMKKAQQRIMSARPFATKVKQLMSHLITDEDRNKNVFIAEKDEIRKVLVVVITADRGLCGAFNSNLIKRATEYYTQLEDEGKRCDLYCVGRKGADHFRKRDYPVVETQLNIFNNLQLEDALVVGKDIVKRYLDGEYDKVMVIYNEFKSMLQQRLMVEQYLPIPIEENEEANATEHLYIYEPNQQHIFEQLLPRHLETQIWRMYLESNAAELAARRIAMDNATTNAEEMIAELKTKFNKARQSAITTEIVEIVSGANALKDAK